MGEGQTRSDAIVLGDLEIRSPFPNRRGLLPAREQVAYDQLLAGLAAFDERILLDGRFDGDALRRIYRAVHDDNPLIFHCDKKFAFAPRAGRTAFSPRYRMSCGEYLQALAAVQGRVAAAGLDLSGCAGVAAGGGHASAVSPLLGNAGVAAAGCTGAACTGLAGAGPVGAGPAGAGTAGMGPMAKLQVLHDWIVRNCAYGEGDSRDFHEMTGPIVCGQSVCEGIARAYKFLCDINGISSWFVGGWATAWQFGMSSPESHAWNIVTVPLASGGEKSFHVDVTFDCGLGGRDPRFDYFCLSDEEISGDHTIEGEGLPVCEESFDIYGALGGFAGGATEIRAIVAYAVREGRSSFALQVPFVSDASTSEFESLVVALVRDAYGKELARHRGSLCGRIFPQAISMKYYFNPARMTFCFEFSE